MFWQNNKSSRTSFFGQQTLTRVVACSLWFLLSFFYSYQAFANVTFLKEAFNTTTGAALTSVELGQEIEYSFTWNCSFTGTPPVDGCGVVSVTDPIPEGTSFVSCSVPGDYTCTVEDAATFPPNGRVVIADTNGDPLLSGDSVSASIILQVTTDPDELIPGGMPGDLVNVAEADSDNDTFDTISTSTLPVNQPENNWEISKNIIVPIDPQLPALDNDVIYEIEMCPNGPAGIGTGTITIENPTLVDACPDGALVNNATLNGAALGFTGTCSNINFTLPVEFDPADGCQVVRLTLEFPSSAGFSVGDPIVNTATLDGDNVDGDCPGGCTAQAVSELSEPNPDGVVGKRVRRNETAVGAFNDYSISFDTSTSNVLQTGVILTDNFPLAEIQPIQINHTGTWSDPSVFANIIELGTNTVLATGFNGTTSFSSAFANAASGFQVVFTTQVPPGFDAGSFRITFQTDSGLALDDTFTNCASVTTDQISAAGGSDPESCATVTIIEPTSDINVNKNMPSAIGPGDEFTIQFDLIQDNTSSAGAVNPVLSDCIPDELEFISWDSISYTGLDDPSAAADTTNTLPRGVAPNFEFLASGAAGNNCALGEAMIRWSWSNAAPSGSLQLDGSAGVSNPFTLPVRRDRFDETGVTPVLGPPSDDEGDSIGALGLYVRFRMETTFRVKPSIPIGPLSNTAQALIENDDDLRCLDAISAVNTDVNDIDDDGSTADPVCNQVANFNILSAAAYAGSKFVAGFPGLPNYDPDVEIPADNDPSSSTSISTPASCPTDADGRTRTPCVAQAMRDQPFNYRIRLSNDGNVPLIDYVVYDILPNTDTAGSDTGIAESQANVVRGSTWVPLLNGPIMLSSDNAAVAAELANNAIIEYSASSDPCRPELSIATDTAAGWQSGCTDDWTPNPLADPTTFPDGYASVRAWRVNVPFESGGWPVGDTNNPDQEDIIVDVEMLADPDAIGSDYEAIPPELQIAWNNIAFRATNQENDRRLLAAEAPKSGIVMPPDYPVESNGVRVGNLIWADANNNGIADDGEQGIFDVTVELWIDNGPAGPDATDELFDTVQTDAQGHYLFDDADPANRDNLGIPDGTYYVVVPQAQTGSFSIATEDDELGARSSTNGEEISPDDDGDNNDNGVNDNVGMPITAVGGSVEGIYSNSFTLTQGAEPTANETLRFNDSTDDDNDFFTDIDSNVTVDFGFYELRVGNLVWLDVNNNGSVGGNATSAGERILENVLVQLYLDDGDGVFDPDVDTFLESDTTDAEGQYVFDGLDENTYFIAIPAGQTGIDSGSTIFTSDNLVSSTGTSLTPLAGDNNDDGAPGQFGSVTLTDYMAVSSAFSPTIGGASLNESDNSNRARRGDATDANDPNAELGANLDRGSAVPDANSYLTLDFGFTQAVSLGSTIWIDADDDGEQDPGELPIADATITLVDVNGVPVTDGAGNVFETVTDVNGQYNFNGLPRGAYRIQVNLSTSSVPNIETYLPSSEQETNADNNNMIDSNLDYVFDTTGSNTPLDLIHFSAVINLQAGQEPTNETDPINEDGDGVLTDPDQPNQTDLIDNAGNMTLDIGFVPPLSLGSTLFIDNNENGQQDTGDSAIVNAGVTLLNADGTTFDSDPYAAGIQSLTVNSNDNGEYHFNGLPPGDYRVRVDLSSATNSNAAVLIPTPAQVVDPNNNDNDDSNIDNSVPGSTVGTNAMDTATDRVFTSGVITLSSGDEPTLEQDPINDTGDGSDTDPDQPSQTSLEPDANGNMTVDFGFIEPVSIGSVVYLDVNANGVQDGADLPIGNAEVTLLNSNGSVYDSDPVTVGLQSLQFTTGSDGRYYFNGLPEGNYMVQVNMANVIGANSIQPAPNQQVNANTDSNTDSNIATVDTNSTPVVTADDLYRSGMVQLLIGQEPPSEQDAIAVGGGGIVADDELGQGVGQPDLNGNMTVDFGFIQPVSLGSTVWHDLNLDGVQDAGETPIFNATVTLLDDQGAPIPGVLPVTTDINGNYQFDGLAPGIYRVQVNLATVAGGSNLVPSPNQVPDPDVPGSLSENDNTDSNIDISFDDDLTDQIHTSGNILLIAGTEPANEMNILLGGVDQPYQDLLGVNPDTSGNMTLDFGFVEPMSLGSVVWEDVDIDGMQDASEPLITEGIVTLLDGSGIPITGNDLLGNPITTIDLSVTGGTYLFDNLPPGNYKVQITDLPASFIPSPVQNTSDNDDTATDSNIATEPSAGTYVSGLFTLDNNAIEPSGTNEVSDISGAGDDADDVSAAIDSNGNMTVDFGFVAPLSVGSLVWEDTNGDGIQDANEPPIPGAEVTLLVNDGMGNYTLATDISGIAIASQTTTANGLFYFDNLPNGDYKIEVTPPAQFYPSPVQGSADDDESTDSNIIGETTTSGTYESITFTLDSFNEPTEPGTERGDDQDDSGVDSNGNMTLDFGFVTTAAIGNYVWLDLDMDGVQDANEDGIAGVEVTLTPPAGVDVGAGPGAPIMVTTGPNGEYLFPNLPPFVSADPSEGYVVTVDPATLPPSLEQTYDEGVAAGSLGTLDHSSEPIQLDPNEEHLTADFGYAPPLGSIGDTVWVDADDDGEQDPGEPGIAGVTVTLTPPADVDAGNGPGVPVVTTTDGNGKYLFPNLPLDETYIVTVDEASLPIGYGPSSSGLGDPDVRDGFSEPADQDSATVVTITTEEPVNLDADFGYLPGADNNNSIGDTVWIDVDEDGEGPAGANNGLDTNELPVPGVTVTLLELDNMGMVVAIVATTITDENGQYLFTGLPDGNYRVVVTDQNNVLDGLVQTYDNDDGVTVTPNQSDVDLDSAGANPGPEINTDQDFGYVSPSSATGDGTIGDTIFFDEDGSGGPDAGEGIEGVTVLIYGPGPDGEIGGGDDILLDTTTTDENGNYLFTGLDTSDTGAEPGTEYQVVVDTDTLPNGGTGWVNSVDPDTANPGDSISITSITSTNPVDLDQDFGYIGADMNSLSGTVWPDTDGDGEQVESGVFGGVTIELLDENGNVIGTTSTDVDGNYMFDNLPDGIYTVVVTDDDNVLSGFEHTDSPNGLTDISDRTSKDDTGYVVDLDSTGQNTSPVVDVTGDFGYKPTVTNPISLGSFLASKQGNEVRIDWVTQTEVANLGFYLYEMVDGEWQRLTDQLILGQGDSTNITEYTYVANSQARVFALVDVDSSGTETLHGPFMLGQRYGEVSDRQAIDWSAEKSEREAKESQREARKKEAQERRLQQLKQQQVLSDDGDISMWQDNKRGVLHSIVTTLLATFISSAQAAEIFEWTNVVTTASGVYQLDHADLTAEGVDLSGVDVNTIGLMNQGAFVPIRVTGGDVFGDGASIQFVAEAIDTIYTNQNVYTLTTGGVPLRIAPVTVPVNNSTAYASSYLASRKYAPQTSYSFTSPDAADPWYAKRMVAIGSTPVSEDFDVTLDNVAPGGNSGVTQAKLRLSVWGASDLPGSGNDHFVAMSFNNESLGQSAFNGIRANTVKTNITDIRDGVNTVQLTLPMEAGHAYDAVNVNEIEVQYPRKFVAQDNRLAFTSEFGRFRLTGFTGNGDALVLRKYQGQTEQVVDANTSCNIAEVCRVTFGGVNSAADYYVTMNPYKATIQALPMTQDITSGNANYLIIAHPDFIGAAGDNQLEGLQTKLLSEMGTVAIVDVEAIYAQFGHHVYDPTAIQRYVAYAQANRGTNYVLLVGGDVYDYRQFENEDAQSFVPSLYAATGNGVMHAPVDALYVDVNADNVPDIPIARLPVRTNAQLANLLTKRDDYLNRGYLGKILLVADEYDAAQQYDFGDDADEIKQDYLQNYVVSTAYADDLGVTAARAEVINQINQGVTMTSFFGHSSTNQWSFNGLFTGNDAAGLANVGKPTVVTQWGCWNAYYVSPNEDSMGHRFMMEGDQGAVAVMGSSTLTNADAERRLARLIFERLTMGQRLGDAVTQAKQAYAQDYPEDIDVLLGWTILGLPELRVN